MNRRILRHRFNPLHAAGALGRPWALAAKDLFRAFEECLMAGRDPLLSLALVLLATGVAWFLYVPIHELAHALGCLAAGGKVQELQIAPLYGGRLWEKLFPFVVSGGSYAGRLTRFDTRGSDLVYLATDFAPYVFTLLGGTWLLRRAIASRNPAELGLGAVLITAPVLSLTGDYYEMGSVMVSGILNRLSVSPPGGAPVALRHDDLPRLLSEFGERFASARWVWGALVVLGFAVGVLLAGATLDVSRRVADRLAGRTGNPD